MQFAHFSYLAAAHDHYPADIGAGRLLLLCTSVGRPHPDAANDPPALRHRRRNVLAALTGMCCRVSPNLRTVRKASLVERFAA